MELIYKDEVFEVISAAMEVHRKLGPGFLEAVYHEAMEIELTKRGVAFESHKPLQIIYDDNPLRQKYEADMLTHGKIIAEYKALSGIIPSHVAQLINYLKATKMRVGLLINFGEDALKWKRLVN